MLIRNLCIIGVGLIGGSLARALKRARVCGTITGFDREPDALERARALGVIDLGQRNLAEAVRSADVIVLAAPPGSVERLLRGVRPALTAEAVVTDVGSVKGSVVEAARRTLGPAFARFVPGHPIAGTERSGVESSFAELFDGRLVILTPVQETEVRALSLVSQMWERAGAQVTNLSVDDHDRVLAATSHLPHMLAYALVDCLAGMDDRSEIFRFAAGGFADFTRIASSSPVMWRDVCLSNREQLLKAIDVFDTYVAGIRQAIASNDSARLEEIFSRAKRARDAFAHRYAAPATARKPSE